MSGKIKVLMVGPSQSGKTVLSNFLSDSTEWLLPSTYRPTHVVRIVEFEVNAMDVELWDVSGNHAFENAWPALHRDANAVVFVFNPDQERHARELEVFHSHFVERAANMGDAQCVVLAYWKSDENNNAKKGVQLPSQFNRIPQLEVSDLDSEEGGRRLRADFEAFLINVAAGMNSRNEQEEMNIMAGNK